MAKTDEPTFFEVCPKCDEAQDAGPERGRWAGPHCWRCGYREGPPAPPGATPEEVAAAAAAPPALVPSLSDAELGQLTNEQLELLAEIKGLAVPEKAKKAELVALVKGES